MRCKSAEQLQDISCTVEEASVCALAVCLALFVKTHLQLYGTLVSRMT